MQTQSNEKIETLKNKVKGQIVLPDDPNYNEVREIWNAMIDRKPAVIVQCADADDVLHALSYARENGLEISIRGAGHNIAGSALCDNGVLIDFSNMTNVRVDAQNRRAFVELELLDFPQIKIYRAFLLIFSQLEHFLQSSIDKISSISSIKIKIFYTKFTPRGKSSIPKKIVPEMANKFSVRVCVC